VTRGAVASLLSCSDPEVLLEGPAGTGKTMGLLTKADACAWQYPGCRILLVRATRAALSQSVLVTFEQKVLLSAWRIADGTRRENRAAYLYPNGSEIVCGGLDNADRLMSTEFDLICGFEWTVDVTEDDHEKLCTRLRHGVMPYQQIVTDCNPGSPQHWLNRRASAGKMRRLVSRHRDNPALWDGGDWTAHGSTYLSKLDALSGVRRLRLRDGKWAQAEGVVYDGWDPAIHVIDAMPKGWESWEKFRSIDMGFTNPFVCQWWARDPDGRLYLYREMYQTQRLVSDWAKIIGGYPEPIVDTVSDHDAEDRATLEAGGVSTIAAKKDVASGIQAVTSRLRVQPDGKPRLFVLRSALVERDPARDEARQPCGFLEEVDGYSWKRSRDGQAKEEPVKEHDHSMDTCRYMVMHLDWEGDRSGCVMMGAEPWATPKSDDDKYGAFAPLRRGW
jgi:phage terminase large subunit